MTTALKHLILRGVAAPFGAVLRWMGLSPFEATVRGTHLLIDMEQFVDFKIFMTRRYEEPSVDRMVHLSPRGGTVVDVGANIGLVSLKLAEAVGPSGHVVAFEPSEWARDRLIRNLALNDAANVIVEQAAAGATTEEAMTLLVPNGYRLDGRNTAREATVKLWALDDYLAGRKIDLLKIDTDGWERDVLMGAVVTIEAWRPVVMFEFCPKHAARNGFDPLEPFDILAARGYHFEGEDGRKLDRAGVLDQLGDEVSLNVFAYPD